MRRLFSNPTSFFFLTCLAILLTTVGCSTSEQATSNGEQVQNNHAELESIFWDRIQESRTNFTQADVDFMTGMIAHHAQALIMSRLAPENGASQSIQVMAARIINAQKDEITTMQQWLRDREQPVPEVHIDGLNLMVHSTGGHGHHAMHDHENMAGMLSQDQLEELAEARDREFDKLFLRYMIQHHEGAVTMVQTLFDTDGAALDEEAFRLAADINVDQITEIARMELMLEEIENS